MSQHKQKSEIHIELTDEEEESPKYQFDTSTAAASRTKSHQLDERGDVLNLSSSSSNNSSSCISINKKLSRFAKTKQKLKSRSEQHASSSFSGSSTALPGDSLSEVLPSCDTTLLPPLPRAFLTQSVSLAPLSLLATSTRKHAQHTSPNTSNTAAAFNLSHDFDRSLNLRRSKRFVRQLTPASLATTLVLDILSFIPNWKMFYM